MVSQPAPFAQALLELGQENGKEFEYLEDLEQIEKTFKENPDLKQILMHPRVSKEDKYSLLQQLFGDESDQTLMHFLQVVCAHRISGRLDEIAREYQKQYDASKNIQNVTVYTASELDDAQKEALQKALEKKLECAVRMQIELDPSLIAGVKVVTPHYTIDGSYKGRIEKMKEQLKS